MIETAKRVRRVELILKTGATGQLVQKEESS